MSQDAGRGRFPGLFLIVMGCLVVVAYLAFLFAYRDRFPGDASDKHERWGQLADFLGGMMSPIIGLAGFAGVIVTLHQQHRQLKAERDEFHREQQAREDGEKVARLLHYIATWDAPDFRENQDTVRFAFKWDGAEGGNLKVFRGAHISLPKTRTAVARIYGFFARLELMLQSELVRAKDVQNLLTEELREWMGYLPKLDFTIDTKDSSPNIEEDRAFHQWFVKQVFPLARRFGHMPPAP